MPGKPKTAVLKNLAALLMGQVTTSVLSLLVTVYVPRRIGPEAIGELTVAGIITSLVSTFLTLGIGTILLRDISRDQEKAADLIGTVMVIRMLMALPAALLVIGIGLLIGYSPETQVLIAMSAVGMVITLLTSPFQTGFQAFERMKFNSLSAVLSEVLIVVSNIAIVLAGGGVVLLSLANLLVTVIMLFLSIKWWRSLGGVNLRINAKLMRYIIVKGLPFWATGLFFTFYVYIDSFMLSVMTNDTVVGWYNVPTQLFGFMLVIPTLLGTALFPALARLYKHAPREMVKLARRNFNLITCLSLPMAVGGMLLAKQIILTLYGLAFGESIPVLIVLSAMVVPTSLNVLVYDFLVVTERQGAWTKVMAGACILNPLMNLGLITFYQRIHQNGAFGAAWALFLTEGIMAVVGIVLLPRGILGWSNVKSMAKSMAAAGLMALGVWYTRGYFLAIPIVTGIIVYAGAVLLLGVFPREDFGMLNMVATKILHKVGIKRALPQADANGL